MKELRIYIPLAYHGQGQSFLAHCNHLELVSSLAVQAKTDCHPSLQAID